MSLELALEIALDTGTVGLSLKSSGGYELGGTWYDPRIISSDPVSREIDVVPGNFRTSGSSCEVDDADGFMSALKASTPFKNRLVTWLLFDPEAGSSSKTDIYTARIQTWSKERDTFTIQVSDDPNKRFQKTLTGLTTKDNFADIESSTPVALIPRPYGTHSSAPFDQKGRLPAYLVDAAIGQPKYRYIAARGALKDITSVYRYGVPVTTIPYTPQVAAVMIDGVLQTVTFIDFDSDMRDFSRLDGREITYDTDGLTDDGTVAGAVITNPALQLYQLLLDEGILDAMDVDAPSLATAQARYDAQGIVGALYVNDPNQSVRDIMDRAAPSFLLDLFVTGTGQYGFHFYDGTTSADPSTLPDFSDQVELLDEEFSEQGPDDTASSVDSQYAQSPVTGQYDGQHTQTDAARVTELGEDIRLKVDRPYLTDPNAVSLLSQISLFATSDDRQILSVAADAGRHSQVEIGTDIRITHFAGVSADKLGFRSVVFRILGVGFEFSDEAGVIMKLKLVDNPGLGAVSPGIVPGSKSTTSPPPEPIVPASNIVLAAVDEDTVQWYGPAGPGGSDGAIILPLFEGTQTFGGIAAGDTGNVAGETYIYFDPEVSQTVLQTTTDKSLSIGRRKVLVARVMPSAIAGQRSSIAVAPGFGVSVASDLSPSLGFFAAGQIRLPGTGTPYLMLDGDAATPEIAAFNSLSVQTLSFMADGSGYLGSPSAFSWNQNGVITMTGVLIRTAAPGNDRSELQGNAISFLDSADVLQAKLSMTGSAGNVFQIETFNGINLNLWPDAGFINISGDVIIGTSTPGGTGGDAGMNASQDTRIRGVVLLGAQTVGTGAPKIPYYHAQDKLGVNHYLFFNTAGQLKRSTTAPLSDDTIGTIIG